MRCLILTLAAEGKETNVTMLPLQLWKFAVKCHSDLLVQRGLEDTKNANFQEEQLV